MSWKEHRREGESRHPDRWEPTHEEGRHRERRGSPSRRPRDRSPPWISERREYDRERDCEREKHRARERDERDDRRSDSRRRDDDRRRERDRERARERDRARERRHHDERSRGDSYDGKRSGEYMQDSEPILRDDEEGVGDWYCTCGFLNFKRRFICYRNGCNLQRSDGFTDLNQEAAKEVSNGITRRLLFRNLDALTTEETVLQVLTAKVPDIAKTITGITIGRDSLTSASRGVCYVNFNTLPEATAAYAALAILDPPLMIDNRSVLISYCSENAPDRRVPSPIPTPPPPPSYSETEFPQFFSTAVLSENDKVNAAAAVAQSAISQLHARASGTGRPTPGATKAAYVAAAVKQTPNGDGLTKYSPPDVRTFLYDESSGYYYDPLTGLYYDSNTQYFYNNQISQYMYWDANNLTYILAPQTTPNMQAKLPTPPEPTQQNTLETPSATVVPAQEEKKPKIEKQDRVKVAKKIAKDMERWARTLNQKKNTKNGVVAEPNNSQTKPVSGSADIGFTVLGQQQDRLTERALLAQSIVPAYTPPTAVAVDISPSKIIEQESFNAIRKYNSIEEEDEGIIDWSKLACLLCKRQFPSSDVITKHKNLSELHRTNLAEFRKLRGITDESANQNYRDRAAERRMKYGEDDTPVPRKNKKYGEKQVPAPVHAAEAVIDTVGGKMLQKMGWSQGRGLGKEEQGRTAPIEAGQRPTGAGLGVATAEPGETYKNKVKRLMMARFQDMTE